MKTLKVQDVYYLIDKIAPFETAEDFDNVGLIVGDTNSNLNSILITLDADEKTIDEAIDKGAGLIVSHHPLLFKSVRSLNSSNYDENSIIKLLKHNISLIAAHTNIDKSEQSPSFAMAEKLNLSNITQATPYVVTGELNKELTVNEFEKFLEDNLGKKTRIYSKCADKIKKIALAGGSYGAGYIEAKSLNADAYITGEIRHNQILEGLHLNLLLAEVGHYESERCFIPRFCDCLQSRLNALQYKVTVFSTTVVPF